MTLAQQRALAILHGLGAPITPGGVAILVAWQACEGGVAQSAGHNPMNTTLAVPGSRPLPGNPDGVQLYPSEGIGIAATVRTLQNGDYPRLVAALRAGSPAAFVAAAPEIQTWGTNPACIARRLGQALPMASPPLSTAAVPAALVAAVIGIPWVLALRERRR
jgi:hypothetical protein